MNRQLKFGAMFLLTASLFYGFAARAQGIMQTERVSYALTLIDAGTDGTGNTKTGGPVTTDTEYVRVKVTVSVPRTANSNVYGAIPTYASPARLMFRKHRGTETAFDGTIALTRDAPYAADGSSLTSAYYPMPQCDADGYAITDSTALNLAAVRSGSASNVDGTAYADYLGYGQAHNLGRWEATYLSPAFAMDDIEAATEGSAANLLMLKSLVDGEATYEWFVASRRGLGSAARISDIQDHGRNLSCTDVRLWTPSGEVSANIDDSSRDTMGQYETWTLASMADNGWSIYGGAPGSNYSGAAGVQLLNTVGSQKDYSDTPRIESPVYPDGISAVTFEALTSAQDSTIDATLLVQTSLNGGAWVDYQTVTLAAGIKTFTIDFADALPENSAARFRLVRSSMCDIGGSANLLTYVIRNIIVRSAAPAATFTNLEVQVVNDTVSAEPYEGNAFNVKVKALAETGKLPRGYEGEVQLRRRAKDDNARAWYSIPATVSYDATTGNGSLTAAFEPGTVLANPDGSLNVKENAFFVNANGELTGVLAGVYDVAILGSVLGSFEAGRDIINGYEAVTQTLTGYDVEEENENGLPEIVHYPYVLNVREKAAAAESVFLRVMYRTGTSEKNYDLDTFDIPLLPSAKTADLWRVDVSKTLRLPLEIEALVKDLYPEYAWGYEPDSEDEEKLFEEGYISFKLCAVDKDGKETWYGQDSAISAATLPTVVEVVPAVAETLAQAESEAAAVPVLVAVDALPNSHLMVEVNLADANAVAISLAGSFWQDFNTWDPSEVFCKTEFREDVTAVTADFDCTTSVDETTKEVEVSGGWIPDEGPLADTTSFLDEVTVGRISQMGEFPFTLRDISYIGGTHLFAPWGASYEYAEPQYMLPEGSTSYCSDYLQFDNAEVVLRRSWDYHGAIYRPDALFRLRGAGSLSPRDDTKASITLNGVGKVSFSLSLSLPYNVDDMALLLAADEDAENPLNVKGTGLSASVILNNESQTCAPSGYSVSYYLVNYYTRVFYELRVSQVVDFPLDESQEPAQATMMELYKWQNGSPTRLVLKTSETNPVEENYHHVGEKLANNTYGLWVMADGRLAIGHRAGTTNDALTTIATSKDVQITTTTQFNLALGSAECRPSFRYIDRVLAAADAYNGSPISPDLAMAKTYSFEDNVWLSRTDSTTSGRLEIVRRTPTASEVGRVKVTAYRGGEAVKTRDFYTDKMDQLCEVVIGAANATLKIEPYDRNCNVFIDNIAISSWCGKDENRNGRDKVPLYTDVGFSESTGFSGVGVWIRPTTDDQLNVLLATYTGEQCVLLQRSRQNNNNGYGETETDGITHTGNAMALYLPFSEVGFGPVSFRYRIPQTDEYGSGKTLSSAWVMLQYLEDRMAREDFLNSPANESSWKNVSAPVELRNTGGDWSMVSITPKQDDVELIGVKGTLRLVMVITKEMVDTDDPYVYIDDLRMTSNETGSTASWTATNVRVAETPINQLYWKDRLATDSVVPAETTFAQKQTLTRGMEFNDVMTDEETEGSYATTVIESPILENGVGRVTFAARLTEPQAKPVRLYLCATTDTTEAKADLKPVTYVDVASTIYTVYDIDLSKYKNYYTKPNADGSPSTETTGDVFTCSTVRRLTIKAFIEGDGVQTDGFGSAPSYGRVLVDQLAIANPVLPSIRVASVAFSNLPENMGGAFDARSPLSQPVQNASDLRVMVRLDREQLLKRDSIRVFVTVDPHAIDTATASVKRMETGYVYNDVLGGQVEATAEHPVYTWNPDDLEAWPLSAWFDLNTAFTTLSARLGETTILDAATLSNMGIKNTIELKLDREGTLNYTGSLTELVDCNLLSLPENSLVRYNAWAVYQSEDSDQWFCTQITPVAYTEFPWYFPRSLNAELREKASTETDVKTATFFSPYYWVYSYLPGEAFINEFNFEDNSSVTSKQFVEICAPVNTSLAGWRIELTGRNDLAEIVGNSVSIPVNDPSVDRLLPEPDLGAVPYQRKDATSAQRAFYTAFTLDSNKLFYYDEDGNKQYDFPRTKNAGVAEQNMGWWSSLGSGSYAGSVRLHRPTGGAEHIVCFALNREANVTTKASQDNLNKIYTTYQTAYADKGFGSEWEQTFTTGSWEDYMRTTTPDAFGGDPTVFTAKMHARRLVKADVFTADASKDNRFSLTGTDTAYVNDQAKESFSNSIATVDMGGIFVTRKNAINVDVDNGPLDLTDIIKGTWPTTVNPTTQTRIVEPEGGTENLDPVVQVTPRQINPDQYLILYSGFSSSVVNSELSGRLGMHSLESFDENDALMLSSAAGRETPYTWGLSSGVERTALTYTAFPFHTVESVMIRVKDASDPSVFITDATELAAVLKITNASIDDFSTAATNEGWMTLTVPAGTTSVVISTQMTATNDEEVRYSVEAKASFALDETGGAARDVITRVRPYCGEGSAEYPMPGSAKFQPWWGSNFGFEVAYDDAILDGSATLTSVIVTYPSPSALNQAWGLNAEWCGWAYDYETTDPTDPDGGTITQTTSLEGMEYADAIEALKSTLVPNNGTRYVELFGHTEGVFADASLVSIPGDAYAKAAGYDAADVSTATKKEPAVPFCVWGVYTVTLSTSHGNEKVSFLMRQAMPDEMVAVWTYPQHYAPMTNLNEGKASGETMPYFHLYSTPPQAAWVNEVNLTNAAGADTNPFVEVVFPVLRNGILNAANPTVPQAEPTGWNVRRYDATGTASEIGAVADGTMTASGSTSYNYYTLSMAEDTATTAAYVLHRPCGAAEGGVWTGVDADGNTKVTPPGAAALADNAWLVPPEASLVMPGVTESGATPGSVQLIGKVVYRDGFPRISSAAEDRFEWTFATTSEGKDNEGIRPDTKPVWNQVTITSTLRNTVYAGTSCGYQLIPGAFDQEGLTGETDPVTLTLGGNDWVYNDAVDGLVLSYRPRANYRFESMTLPAELIGKVMLIGRRGSLTPDTILERVTEYKNLAAIDANAPTTTWLTLDGRATLEMQTVVGEDGTATRAPTGKIIFDTTFVEGSDEDGEPITFGDADNYVISLVFVTEPASAQNSIEVAFGQGEVKVGAWMVTQTLYALDADGNPDETKGGAAVSTPIWSDEEGDKNGENANLHGWLYQPITGDTIGMTAVINPELGLQGGRISDPAAALASPQASLRPFLVWTAIPKDRVPTNLFDASLSNTAASGITRNDFIKGWGVNTWLGTPSVQDGVTMQLSALRQKLRTGAASTAATALYSKAGIIPMVYTGYCDANKELSQDEDAEDRPSDTLLAFRTMTADELADAIANGDTTGLSTDGTADTDTNPLLPYTSSIDMTDATFWKDGAILRFAVVIADALTGYVYDCQSISNFSSEVLEAYCPWYIPEEATNVNRVTSSTEAGGGVSPFAWVYNIPQGGVWINEFRPFAIPTGTGQGDVASAFELAMYASPLSVCDDDTATYIPTRSLDGWKVVTRFATMPAWGSAPETPIVWTTHKEVPLKGWIPYRRIAKSLALSGNNDAYVNGSFDLDFYAATVDPTLNTAMDFDATMTITNDYYRDAPYTNSDGTVNENTFQWYNFNLKTKDQDFDLFEAGLQELLASEGDIIYSIILVRNNGAIEDEVIFYSTDPYAGLEGTGDYLLSRLETAVESEVVNKTCAGSVRVVTTALPSTSAPQVPAQFLKKTDGTFGWYVAPRTEDITYSTFSSPNYLDYTSTLIYTQPYAEYEVKGDLFFKIDAGITGGEGASLALANMGNTLTGRTVSGRFLSGTGYTLTLNDWDTDWYKLASVTRNNVAFTPVESYTLATTYALSASATTYATKKSITIDTGTVTASVVYNLVFTYTDEAALLEQSGALASTDEAFVEWLQTATPSEIATQTETDGVTASEKYWLGATTPTEEMNPALDFTYIGMLEDTDATLLPTVSVLLSNDDVRITELQGDGNVVLIGKKELSDADWVYVVTLAPADLEADKEISLSTDCKFFKAVLMSDAEVQALSTR